MTVAPTPVRGFMLRPLHVGLLAGLFVLLLALIVFLLVRDSSSTEGMEGSGVSITQTRSLPPFTAVELAGAADVSVRVGQQRAVTVRADDNLIDRITTEVVDGALIVATRGSFSTASPMTVAVTIPELEAATLTGTGAVRIDEVDAPRFEVQLLGAGLLTVAGKVNRLEATLDGTGDAQLGNLVGRDVVATVSGTGRLEVHATRSLDASVPGTGAILYSGNPSDVKQSLTGTGAIFKR